MRAHPRSKSKLLPVTLLLSAVFLATSACSGGSSDSSGHSLTGEPIKVMTFSTLASNPIASFPEVQSGVEARVAAINNAGGIKGRPIEAIFCDDGLTPTGVAKCANEAVSEDVVAVIGGLSSLPGFLPILEKAGIPYLGSSGMSSGEYDSPVSFPVSGGVPAIMTGLGYLANEMGLGRVVFMGHDAPLNGENLANVEFGLAMGDATLVRSLRVALASKDFSSYATAAIEDGVDGIILQTSPNTAGAVIKAIRRAGFDGPVLGASIQFTDASIEALGADGENVHLISTVANAANTTIPAVEQFRNEMTKLDPDALKDEISLSAWTGMALFESLVEDMTTINSETVIEAITELSTPIDVGTTAPYAAEPSKAPDGFPQMYNPTVTVSKVVDGKAIQEGGFINPYKPTE